MVARTEAHDIAPDFEENEARVLDLWTRFGVPALRELQAAIDQFGADFDSAARIDFDGLRRAGCPEWRVTEMQTYVTEARRFMSAALEQLSRIPGKIDSLQPQDEEPWIITATRARDRIEFEMRGVLDAASRHTAAARADAPSDCPACRTGCSHPCYGRQPGARGWQCQLRPIRSETAKIC